MSYEQAGTDVVELIADRIDECYQETLGKAGVTVACVLKFAPLDKDTGKPKGAALKLHGWPCAATVKITPLLQRVLGVADVVITLDGDRWTHWSDGRKAAIIDHELHHVGVTFNTADEPDTDDHGRPKLHTIHHDWQTGGFREIVERHGPDALEVTQATDFIEAGGDQLLLGLGWTQPAEAAS